MADRDDDDIFEDRETGDELSDKIREELAKQNVTDDEDDEAAFSADLGDEGGLEMVGEKEGREIATDAQLARKAKPVDQEPAKEPAEAAPDEGPEAEPKQAEDLTTLGLDDLMKGVQHTKRAEIARRVSDAEKLMAVTRRPYIAAQIKQHGATPGQVIDRLGELAEFAAQKPDEYLAWVASQSAGSPEKIPEVLGAAAKLLGYKVVPDREDIEDDAYEDERVLALKREVEQLRTQIQGGRTNFGPDTPARVQHRTMAQQVADFTAERDETGGLKRPFWNDLEPQVVAMADIYRQQQNRALTIADLDLIYRQAEGQMRARFGLPAAQSPAAQPVADVGRQYQQRAAAADKAVRASKSVDGTGQGASRRPALPEGADIGDIIRDVINRMN